MLLTLRIPDDGCKNCPYLSETIIDHNYYGEFDHLFKCRIFNCGIVASQPCLDCKLLSEKSQEQEDVYKYAEFLVKKINEMMEEEDDAPIGD